MVNCVVCGRDLKTNEKWKKKCFDCFKKTELKGKKDTKGGNFNGE